MFLKKNRAFTFLSFFAFFAFLHSLLSSQRYIVFTLHFLSIFVFGSLLFILFSKITKKKKLYSNTAITLIILLLLIHPIGGKSEIFLNFLAVITALFLKFIGEYKNTPLINPSVAGLFTGMLVSASIPDSFFLVSWWGTTFFPFSTFGFIFQVSLLFLFIWLFFGVRFFQKLPLLISYLSALFLGLFFFSSESAFVWFLFLNPVLYFFAGIILIDPKTSPIKKQSQVIYGVLLGILSVVLHVQNVVLLAQEQFLLCSLIFGSLGFFFWRLISSK